MDELNETMVNDNDVIETVDEPIEEESNRGIGGKIALGIGLLTVAGAAGAAYVAKKKGKLDEIKAKREAKKIERLEKQLEERKNRYTVIDSGVESEGDEK